MMRVLSIFISLAVFMVGGAFSGPTTLAELDERSRVMVEEALEITDGYWQEETGSITSVRNTSYYALGLLLRDEPGDFERALTAIDSLCRYQYDAPGKPYHGTYYRRPNDPAPPENARVWKDYDPNWREFVGTHFALILACYEERLPKATVAKMDASLRLAAEGAYARRVRAEYTNISLMSAYLLAYTGKRHEEGAWQEAGRKLAVDVYERFSVHGTFDEYNSPTYYGVDLFALNQWQTYPPYPEFAAMGKTMADRFWGDIAEFYHAGMGNMCGPYDRSYGMDMGDYMALLGMYIGIYVSEANTPLPLRIEKPPKLSEYFSMAGYALVQQPMPAGVVEHFESFLGTRNLERSVGGRYTREISAWLSERVMMGGGVAPQGRPALEQAHPVTIHWLTESGEVAWMRMRCNARVVATAKDGELVIRFRVNKRKGPFEEIQFECHIPGGKPVEINETQWKLDGLTLKVDAPFGVPKYQNKNLHTMISWSLAKDMIKDDFSVILSVVAE